MISAPKFLQWYGNEGEKFRDHILTGGEQWRNQETVHGLVHSGLPKHRKFKQTFHGRKLMSTVFGTEKVHGDHSAVCQQAVTRSQYSGS